MILKIINKMLRQSNDFLSTLNGKEKNDTVLTAI